MSNSGIRIQARRGIVRGNIIELVEPTEFADGQELIVTMERIEPGQKLSDSALRGFGAWSDDPEGVDRFVEETYRQRQVRSGRTFE